MKRKSLSVSLLKAAVLAMAAAGGLAACQSESVGTAQDALTNVQGSAKTCESLGTGVHACLATLHTCVQGAADAAALATCKTAFTGCLPADPPPSGHHGMAGGHHGGHHGPPPGGAHDGPHGGGDMAGGCPGMGGDVDACNPGAPLIEACRVNLDACLAAGAGPAACVTTADECVSAAIQERFQAICAAQASAVCDDATTDAVTCDQLDRACNDGVTLPAPVAGTVKIQIIKK